jgi:hypothetical protein
MAACYYPNLLPAQLSITLISGRAHTPLQICKLCKVKVAVYTEPVRNTWTLFENHVEFFNVKPVSGVAQSV